jgi:hypothetical protein
MLHHVALVRTNVLEEFSASFIRATRIGELGTTLAVTSNRRTLQRNTAAKTSNLTFVSLVLAAIRLLYVQDGKALMSAKGVNRMKGME